MIDKISVTIDGVDYCSIPDHGDTSCDRCAFKLEVNGHDDCTISKSLAFTCVDAEIYWEKVEHTRC